MQKQDPYGISGWQRISYDVTTSGHLNVSDLADLAELRVKHVIDLAPADHPNAIPDEGEKLAEMGIGHTLIEVPFNKPLEEHYQAFKKAYSQSPRPIHVHCIYNFRSSAFLFRYHLESGMPEDEARQIMRVHWSPDKSNHRAALPWKAFIDETIAKHAMPRRLANAGI